MAQILKTQPDWASKSWRLPGGNWAYEDESQKCILVEIGELNLRNRPQVPPAAILNRAKVALTMREILARILPVGQVWIGLDIVIRFDEFESAMIKHKHYREDIFVRALLVDILYEYALQGEKNEE